MKVYGSAANGNKSTDVISFEENKNQWAKQVLFKADIKWGRVFLEKQKLVYVLYSLEDLDNIHTKSHRSPFQADRKSQPVRCHALYVNFLNANRHAKIEQVDKLAPYHNYFIGNDPSKWASRVSLYKEIQYKNIYKDIDLNVYGDEQNLKYDFVINAKNEIKP